MLNAEVLCILLDLYLVSAYITCLILPIQSKCFLVCVEGWAVISLWQCYVCLVCAYDKNE